MVSGDHWSPIIYHLTFARVAVTSNDFQVGELFQRGGWIAARRLFGAVLPVLLEELNQALVA